LALTKENIISQVYETTQLPKNRSRDVVETALELMKKTLEQGEDLLVSGFGKFMVKDKKARRGRNPQTREDLRLRARRVWSSRPPACCGGALTRRPAWKTSSSPTSPSHYKGLLVAHLAQAGL